MKTFCGLTTDGMLDYLAAIYKLGEQNDRITTGALAEQMHVSAAAASSMLKRLEESNLVERSSSDGVILTEQGRLAALQLIRRHRLLEVFLNEVMGFSWDQVDVEAHRLEHGISVAFEERMDEMCGYPTHCPHGDPIPAKDGTIADEHLLSLVELVAGQEGHLQRVGTDDPRVLRYLSRLGLTPGQLIRVVEIAPFNGPVSVERLGLEKEGEDPRVVDRQILGNELAGLLFVRPLTGAEAGTPTTGANRQSKGLIWDYSQTIQES